MKNNMSVAEQATLFPFTPPKHSDSLCIPVQTWEFLCHTLYLKRYPFLLGPKGCGKSSIAKELADAMGMEYFAFDMGQAFKPKKMFVGGLIIGDDGKTKAVRSEFFKAFVSTKPTLIFLDELTRTVNNRISMMRIPGNAIIKAKMCFSWQQVTWDLPMFPRSVWIQPLKIVLSKFD